MTNDRPSLLSANCTVVDWLVAAALALLVVATRWPFRTTMLYNWDSANFALGMRHFDVTVHAPHPPGYFFYVALANLINQIVGEANASLVLLSVLFSAGAVIATYFLGKAMFGRRAGLIASLLLTFSVTFWTYGELALAYPSLALFSGVAAFIAWRIISANRTRGGLAVLLSVVYVVGSGFRPDLLLFLAPLWLWCLWLQGWRTRIICALVALAGFSLWYVPTALLSGGFAQYHAVLLAYLGTDVAGRYSSTNKGLAGLVVNLRDTASYVFYALYAAAIPLIGGILWLLMRQRTWLQRSQLRTVAFFLVWVLPMVAFYTIIHIGDPGYVFTFLPAIMVLLGAFLSRTAWANRKNSKGELSERTLTLPSPFGKGEEGECPLVSKEGRGSPLLYVTRRFQNSPLLSSQRLKQTGGMIVTAAVILANAGIFLFHPRPMTAQGIRQNDLDYREKIDYIQTQLEPRSTILLSYDSYKHLLYYLPEYRQSIWVDVFTNAEGQLQIPTGVKSILLVDARLAAIDRSLPLTREVRLPSGGRMYLIAATAGQILTVGGAAIEVHY